MKAWLGWSCFPVCLFALFDYNKHQVCIGWLHSCWPLKVTRCCSLAGVLLVPLIGGWCWLNGLSSWISQCSNITSWSLCLQRGEAKVRMRMRLCIYNWTSLSFSSSSSICVLDSFYRYLILTIKSVSCGVFFPHYDDFKTILKREHTFLLWFIVGNRVRILRSVIERKTLRLVFLPGIHYQNRKRTSALWLQSQDIRGEWKGA